MAGIFISYRRVDSAGFAGRLWEHLKRHFGENEVFMDIEGGIPRGADFPDTIAKALESASALVVVIGRQWLTCVDTNGTRRLDDADDWVRSEIARALVRGILVLPALVDGAAMPAADQLPDDIRALARRQGSDIRNSSWDYDVGQITASLARVLPARERTSGRRRAATLAGVTLSLVAVTLLASSILWSWPVRVRKTGDTTTPPTSAVTSPDTGSGSAPSPATSSLPTALRPDSPWQSVAVPDIQRVRSADFVTPLVGWLAGKQGLLMMTTDAGGTWAPLNTGLTGDIGSIDLLDGQSGWALDTTGTLAWTHDGGHTWSRTRVEGMRIVRFFDRDHGLLAGQDGKPLRFSADGGAHWGTGRLPEGFAMVGPVAMAVGGIANAWVAPIGKFKEGGILATRDGGKTWSVQSTRNVYYLSGLSMQSETNGWAIGYVFGETFGKAACGNYTTVVFKTTSGGGSWDPVPGAICGFSGAIDFADATHGWISVQSKEGSSIFATRDGGTNWTKQLDLATNVTALQMLSDGSGWAVAEGMVLRYRK